MPVPVSANFSAFKQVIFRFRQRQQQEQRLAKRRLNRQMRRQALESSDVSLNEPTSTPANYSSQVLTLTQDKQSLPDSQPTISQSQDSQASTITVDNVGQPLIRTKKTSDSFRLNYSEDSEISSAQDSSCERKRVCHSIITRGSNNEVDDFPKLFRPHNRFLVGRSSTDPACSEAEAALETQNTVKRFETTVESNIVDSDDMSIVTSTDTYNQVSSPSSITTNASSGYGNHVKYQVATSSHFDVEQNKFRSLMPQTISQVDDDIDDDESRKPRCTKSNSISSDSSTSGTGSMEAFDTLESVRYSNQISQ